MSASDMALQQERTAYRDIPAFSFTGYHVTGSVPLKDMPRCTCTCTTCLTA